MVSDKRYTNIFLIDNIIIKIPWTSIIKVRVVKATGECIGTATDVGYRNTLWLLSLLQCMYRCLS